MTPVTDVGSMGLQPELEMLGRTSLGSEYSSLMSEETTTTRSRHDVRTASFANLQTCWRRLQLRIFRR